MRREYQFGIVDDGEPLEMIVKLYPIQSSFMNTVMGIFSTPREQTEREGGLYVEINNDFKTFKDETLRTLEANPAVCHFEERNLTVRVSAEPLYEYILVWINEV